VGCIIFGGKTGRGKTHLAVAIAYRAIQNGFDARCVTAAELIDDLSTAFRGGGFTETLATYVHPGVLVVDEVGYLTYGTDAANMLFHVVNDRHRKRRAMVFTTNKPLTAWGRVLHDDDLAHAIVDRILERGRIVMLDGPSMRTKHLGLDELASSEASDQPARISGINAPEFPEPTRVDLVIAKGGSMVIRGAEHEATIDASKAGPENHIARAISNSILVAAEVGHIRRGIDVGPISGARISGCRHSGVPVAGVENGPPSLGDTGLADGTCRQPISNRIKSGTDLEHKGVAWDLRRRRCGIGPGVQYPFW
jgi:hypothetical protein